MGFNPVALYLESQNIMTFSEVSDEYIRFGMYRCRSLTAWCSTYGVACGFTMIAFLYATYYYSECKVTKGSIRFLGTDITNADVNSFSFTYFQISERSKMGMGMLFQNPPEIDGLSLKHLIDTAFHENSPSFEFNTDEVSFFRAAHKL